MEGYKGTADVRREYFKNGFPAATGIVVKELLRPDALIEIDAIAVLDEKS
jgi:enamine deaminase RidA (YjgF/YER057c/UK114 family)